MVHRLKITCYIDRSSHKEGSYLYYFLLRIEGGLELIKKELELASGVEWFVRELCRDGFYVVTGRIENDCERLEFEIDSNFVPVESKYVEEMVQDSFNCDGCGLCCREGI